MGTGSFVQGKFTRQKLEGRGRGPHFHVFVPCCDRSLHLPVFALQVVADLPHKSKKRYRRITSAGRAQAALVFSAVPTTTTSESPFRGESPLSDEEHGMLVQVRVLCAIRMLCLL